MRLLTERKDRGQVLMMATLVLIVMCGMLGLAVDLGWSFYVRRSAVAATDAAALAAAREAHSHIKAGPYICGPYVTCQPAPQTCSSSIPSPPGGTNNLDNGCLYAQKNQYSSASDAAWDNVMMSADVPVASAACVGRGAWPNAPAGETVCVQYWVTARAYEGIPQLFSSVLGNVWGGSSARSTAAVVDAVVPGVLYALNRENDPAYNPPGGAGGARFESGVSLEITGNSSIQANGGVYIASQADGDGNTYATESNGNALLSGNPIYIYGSGEAENPDNYSPQPVNNSNFTFFEDPMSGKGQPPAPPQDKVPEYPVPMGQIDGADCTNPRVMTPGSYYAVDNSVPPKATGDPIRVTGCVTFSPDNSLNSWGDYVFFGGLRFTSAHTTATFGPGRYFVAGTKGSDQPVFQMVTGVTLTDMTPLDSNGMSQPPRNQGEIFVFTNADYPGLYVPDAVRLMVAPAAPLRKSPDQLDFGWADIQTGNNSESGINLHGLNREFYSDLQARSLLEFTPTVFWWDQRNSTILYNPDGTVVTEPTDPVLNTDPDIEPFMGLLAGPNTDLYGLVYLPRGAYLDMQGNPGMDSPVRIIAGALNLGGTSSIIMRETAPPAFTTVVSLIE